MMTFGEFITTLFWLGIVIIIGIVAGMFTQRFFGKRTVMIDTIVIIVTFIAIVCNCGDMSVLEFLEELWESELSDIIPIIVAIGAFSVGSRIGQFYKIVKRDI